MTDLITENARLRAGPQIAGYTCKGCVHFRSEYWAEPDGEGGMDSGTSAACAHGEGRHISTYYGTKPPVPDWCPLPKNEACAAPDAPDLTDPTVIHANMLRGTIAKPTVAQIIHIYGSAVFLELLYKRGLCKPTVAPAPDAVQEAARVPEIAALIEAAKDLYETAIATKARVTGGIGGQTIECSMRSTMHSVSLFHLDVLNDAIRAIAGDRT